MALSPASRTHLIDIARVALIDTLAKKQPSAIPLVEDAELNLPAGCFVSLHERSTHRLRGCVGRLDASLALAEAVRQTARDVLDDPRFAEHPITAADLADLEVEVSVLSPPRLADSPLDFDLHDEGIYLVAGSHTGFFLPQVARETGWTKEQLLDRLCTEKLDLPADTWRKAETKLHTFKVEVVGPRPL
ncbi:MAG: AmmeMemoRadiSam system protein A [Tepidisphaeraceae bacterium]